jgi:transcription initiation factor TFIIB
MVETKCGECASRNLHIDNVRGEIVCNDCGLVIAQDTIDPGAEWRTFSGQGDSNNHRAGSKETPLLHDKGLSTDIDWQNRDYAGKSISKNRSQLHRMRIWQRRARVANSSERNLSVALAEIVRMCSQMELPKSITEEAAVIYRMAQQAKICRGRSIEAVVAAVVYITCRQTGLPRTLDEVAQHARAGRKEIGRTSRFIMRDLKIRSHTPRAKDYVSRFAYILQLDASIEAKALEIITQLEKIGEDNGKGPTSICAACLYIASILLNQRRTQKECAAAAGVTEVTIRNRYKDICNVLSIDLAM